MAIDSIEDFVEKDFKKIKEIFKEIITSLQRQERVMSSIVKSYSLFNLQPNQELTTIVQEPLLPPTLTQTPRLTPIHQSFLSNPS